MPLVTKLIAFVLLTVAISVPFGSYRRRTARFTIPWMLAIHLPIPLIIIMRGTVFGLDLWAIPLSLAATIAGQMLGGTLALFGVPAAPAEETDNLVGEVGAKIGHR